jgi:integrase/recombinase XerD
MKRHSIQPSFSVLIRDFFCSQLTEQRNLSPQTVASYRDTFRLLLKFAQSKTKKMPSSLSMDDLNAPLILAFLDHLEKKRGNSIRTRNSRLAAIRSFMKYVSLQEPTELPNVQRVLAIPMKKFDRPLLGFLSRDEINAIISTADTATWSGYRDHVLFSVFYNTGARTSEVIGMMVKDVFMNGDKYVRFHGKGRKDRVIPLWKSTAKLLAAWLKFIDMQPEAPVFPNSHGGALTRSGVENRLRTTVRKATLVCPSLHKKKISPHTFRHTTAMHMLQSGIDITTIALWLGHESPATTHMYIEADIRMKQLALAKIDAPRAKKMRYKPTDSIMEFLDSL